MFADNNKLEINGNVITRIMPAIWKFDDKFLNKIYIQVMA